MRNIIILAIFLISFPAFAESNHIMWPVADDIKFRAAYINCSGERIQDNAPISEDGKTYSVGSWRITDECLNELKADRTISKDGDIKTNKGNDPIEFIRKIELIE